MSTTSLPERPDLDQLRRQAKELCDAVRSGDLTAQERVARHHPSIQPGAVGLAVAQLVIARELGFSSWPKLKAAVDTASSEPAARAQRLVAASVEGRPHEAAALLRSDPRVGERNLLAAVVIGDAAAVRATVAADQEAALVVDDERGWPPLLYACYSKWHQIGPDREGGLSDVVKLLLEAGASPNTNNGAFRQGYRSALHGAVEVNNPSVVRVLLDAGANPDDGRCIEQAADRRDHRCLEQLLARGARVAGTWALGAAVYADDAEAVSLLLEALPADSGQTASEATSRLADAAAAHASYEVVAALLAAGADPNVGDSDVGLSALRCAVRAGSEEVAALLIRHGAADDSTDVDRFIGACVAADRQAAERLLATHPDVRDRLTDEDRAVIVDVAATGAGEAVELMLDLGFRSDVRKYGELPLHSAAYRGNAAVVRVLIERGADVDGRDERFDATPLAFATVGSGEQDGKPGNWIETVRLLVEAGASRDGVWISGKPPSEEVANVLRGLGITPDEQPQSEHTDERAVEPGSIGTGPLAEVARHLEAAYRDFDLELLGSLLHPEVRWSGCSNKAQVLDWYRSFQAEGTIAAVNSVEVDEDAVVLGLSVSRRADGARPAPPRQLFQVFTIDGAEIVDIRFYPDRGSAKARSTQAT